MQLLNKGIIKLCLGGLIPSDHHSPWKLLYFFHVSLSHLPPAEHFPAASLCQCQVHKLQPLLTAPWSWCCAHTLGSKSPGNGAEFLLTTESPIMTKCFFPVGRSAPRGVLLHFRLVVNEASEKLYYIFRKRRKVLMFPRRNPQLFPLPCCHLVTNPAPAPARPKLASNRSNFQTLSNHSWCRHQTLQKNSFLVGRLLMLVDAAHPQGCSSRLILFLKVKPAAT